MAEQSAPLPAAAPAAQAPAAPPADPGGTAADPATPADPTAAKDEKKDDEKCHTCGDDDPPDDNNKKYPDGGWHRGGSSAGVDTTQSDQFEARQTALTPDSKTGGICVGTESECAVQNDPTKMTQSAYVGRGGAYISAPDGGYHFGGSSAGPDMMSVGGHFDANGQYVGGATRPGYYTSYTGVLQQGTYGDCTVVATVNKLAATNGMSADEAQLMAMRMDRDLGVFNNDKGSLLQDGLTSAGYTNVDARFASDGDLSKNIDTGRLLADPTHAQTIAMYPPTRYDADPMSVATVHVNETKLLGAPLTGGHAMSIDEVWTRSDGTSMARISNPWGYTYNLPVNDLGKYGFAGISYGTAPPR